MNREESEYVLSLYITGHTARSDQAIASLRRLCDEQLHDRYELVVVDVLERPQLADDEKILATPTLIKVRPLPMRRIIGDLSDTHKVLIGLDLVPRENRKETES